MANTPFGDRDPTIVAFDPSNRQPVDRTVLPVGNQEKIATSGDLTVKIRLANNQDRTTAASSLIQKMYATRGYPANPIAKTDTRYTFVAYHENQPVGTISLTIDSEEEGLLAEQTYPIEVNQLRTEGARLCEMTKLAIDKTLASKRVFAGLLHITFIYGWRIFDRTDLLLEVAPHHVDYYSRLLGCQVYGEQRWNERVSTFGHLMRLPVAYVDEQITRYGGREKAADTKLLYRYFFSREEENRIFERLMTGT